MLLVVRRLVVGQRRFGEPAHPPVRRFWSTVDELPVLSALRTYFPRRLVGAGSRHANGRTANASNDDLISRS